MASNKHIEKLKEGLEPWNDWRTSHPEVVPDFTDAQLVGADMRGADLHAAQFDDAILSGAYLTGADLRDASLSGTELAGADIHGADLSRAYLWRANLSDATLVDAKCNDADFTEADLTSADLSRADLRGATFTHVNLSTADLRGADLSGADLGNATLIDATLGGCKLGGTNLTRADLSRANLSGADLNGANLDRAALLHTILTGIDLRQVKMLRTVLHLGPSEISVSTISLSEGSIPEVFLRGCGLKDWEIEATKLYQTGLSLNQVTELSYKIIELRSDPLIQFYSCFISYSSNDEAFAKRLYTDLQNCGVRCWFAPEDMKIGDRIRHRIDDSIRLHDKLLLILSETSVTSQWIEQEVETALEKEREHGGEVLFPVRVDDAVLAQHRGWPALIKKTRHIGDFCKWENSADYQRTFARLSKDLRVKI